MYYLLHILAILLLCITITIVINYITLFYYITTIPTTFTLGVLKMKYLTEIVESTNITQQGELKDDQKHAA